MGLIGSIFRLFGLGFIGDAADSIGADKVIKDKAVDYAKDKATSIRCSLIRKTTFFPPMGRPIKSRRR